jgi:hypothetical protein
VFDRFSKRIQNNPILRLEPIKRKARHPSFTAAAHLNVGKASDSDSERMTIWFNEKIMISG